MTARQLVRQHYPEACAMVHVRGRNWHIFDDERRVTPALTAGRLLATARAAWAYAAELARAGKLGP